MFLYNNVLNFSYNVLHLMEYVMRHNSWIVICFSAVWKSLTVLHLMNCSLQGCVVISKSSGLFGFNFYITKLYFVFNSFLHWQLNFELGSCKASMSLPNLCFKIIDLSYWSSENFIFFLGGAVLKRCYSIHFSSVISKSAGLFASILWL